MILPLAWGFYQVLILVFCTTACEVLEHETYKTGVFINKLLTYSTVGRYYLNFTTRHSFKPKTNAENVIFVETSIQI